MESQPQIPEFRNIPENFHPCMSVQVLLNLLNKLGGSDKMLGFYQFFRNKFNKLNNTGAWMLDSICQMTFYYFVIMFLV